MLTKKERENEYHYRWQRKNPDRVRAAQRRYKYSKKYGITPERKEEMLKEQEGHCAICPTTEPGGRWNAWHIDHDHETGKVRALLCTNCNTSLKKHLTPSLLRKMADYLEFYGG